MVKIEAKQTQTVCLIVDDEVDNLVILERTLKGLDIQCLKAGTVNEALKLIASAEFSLCITDMQLPNIHGGALRSDGGIDIIANIHQKKPDIPIIAITGFSDLESTVQVLKLGAFDYTFKPITAITLRHIVNSALRYSESILLKNVEKREYIANNLIGNSKIMRELRSKLETCAYTQIPVYINGESGTGKEVVARVIHRLSSRAEKPFIPVNCSAIPSELVESEFFGHKKGSFSGATQDKVGLFQAAEGGVLFLDEIGDLPFTVQAKLLRAIQEKKIRPVGSTHEIPVDVRILSATHQDLDELVKMGSFRQDLLYRIKVVELRVPPLRERVEDISLLATKILARISTESNMEPPFQLHPDALMALQNYPFYGNVRELQNILERTATVCQSSEISRKDLELPDMDDFNPEDDFNSDEEVTDEIDGDELSIDSEDVTLNASDIKLNKALETESAEIMTVLQQTGHNFSLAAKLLNMTRATLRYRITQIKKSILSVAHKSENSEITSDNHDLSMDSEDIILNAFNVKLNKELEMERVKIVNTLQQTEHNFSLAAKLLNVTRPALRYRIKRIKKSIISVAMAQAGGNIHIAARTFDLSPTALREEIARLWGDKPPKFK